VLTATSAFDDNNLSWMDTGVLDTSPCRWVGVLSLESAEPGRMVFESTAPYQGVWRVVMRNYIKYTADFDDWQADNKTVPQDVVDAITGDDTLDGNCADATVTLVSVEPGEVNNRRVALLTWLVEATEYDV